MTDQTTDSSQFPRDVGNGSMTARLYTVEVRYDYPDPQKYGDFIIDREWRRLPTAQAWPGVPNKTYTSRGAEFGLLTWPAANALRWWAHAEFGLCLQSRIVAHELKETYSITAVGYHDVIGGGGSGERERIPSRPAGAPLTEPVPLTRPSRA